jgi:hypothetical protein
MEIKVLAESSVDNTTYKKGIQEVSEYHAQQLINAGVGVRIEPMVEEVEVVEPVEEVIKKVTKSKKVNKKK